RFLAEAVGDGILLGRAFAFLGDKALAHPALAWVTTLLGPTARGPMIVPLGPNRATAIPGVTLEGPELPVLSLAAVTSDKSVYREGTDVVHLCAVNLPNAGRVATLLVTCQGAPYATHPVECSARGLAHVVLRDLPTGEYEVRWHGAPGDAPACAFTVATY